MDSAKGRTRGAACYTYIHRLRGLTRRLLEKRFDVIWPICYIVAASINRRLVKCLGSIFADFAHELSEYTIHRRHRVVQSAVEAWHEWREIRDSASRSSCARCHGLAPGATGMFSKMRP